MSVSLIIGFFMALVIVIITSVINFLRANKRYIDQEGYVRDGFNHLIHRNIDRIIGSADDMLPLSVPSHLPALTP